MSAVEQRARFEAWAESEGLIGVSHGIMSVNSQTETAWRAWQAALASQAQVPGEVRRAGAMLSNCAYNLAQREHLTADERRSLDEARRAWDAAMIAARRAEWAATAPAPAQAPDWFVLVPREPTAAMLDAAIKAFPEFPGEDKIDAVWAAMIAAAPAPEVSR